MKQKNTFYSQPAKRFLAAAILALTCFAQAQTAATTDWRYTIRPQDTVFELTRQFLKPSISWQILADYNRLPDANAIQAGMQLRMPLRWLALKQAQAKLTALSGDVQIQAPDGTVHQAQLGESLQTGQRIQVGRNSSARLQFADASELIVQPQSTVSMDTLSLYGGGYMVDTQLRLQAGRVEVHANPQGRKGQKFEVITPAAVASVRGTQFVVEAQAARTLEQTTEGQVALQTSAGTVLVQEGYGSAVKAGEKPQPPEVIKTAPMLQNPSSRFVDFPIEFSWAVQPDAAEWVVQVGRDPQMAQLVLTRPTNTPRLDAGALPDGSYHLRAWSLDAQGMPSKSVTHPFDVAIARRQQGPAVLLPPRHFAAGPVSLQLAPLASGQKYVLQMTQDAEGRLPVWYVTTSNSNISLPVPADTGIAHHLWIWIY